MEWLSYVVSPETMCLGINVATLGMIYRVYCNKLANHVGVQTARHFDLDANLPTRLREDYPSGICMHAVIRGAVKCVNKPLRSRYVPGLSGVIQECTLTEHKMQWSPISRFWSHAERQLQRTVNWVPFSLVPQSVLFRSPITVEVQAPLECSELPLRNVYDHFAPVQAGISSALFGWLRGEQPKGLQEQEFLLEEGTLLTGFGTLIVDESGNVSLMPPKDGLNYHLTTYSHAALLAKIRAELSVLKVGCIILGVSAVCLSVYVAYRLYNRIEQHRQEKADADKRDELRRRRLRHATADGGSGEEVNYPRCTICLTNAVEVLLLECGHVCMCTDCAELVSNAKCPICRCPISRVVAAFLP